MNDDIYFNLIQNKEPTFGERIKQIRQISCFTQDEFAEAMCLSSRTPISELENCETVSQVKSQEMLFRLFFFLNDWTYQLSPTDRYREMVNEVLSDIREEINRVKVEKGSARYPRNRVYSKRKKRKKSLTSQIMASSLM